MTLQRRVCAETLDNLPVQDPAAMRSRRDLRRVHRAMGSRGIVLRGLDDKLRAARGARPLRVLELGAGDGSLMLGVARKSGLAWPAVDLTLLDRQPLVDRGTLQAYTELGWTAAVQTLDVFDWAASAAQVPAAGGTQARWDLVVANLFLHHFEGRQLALLLAAIVAISDCFFACEPRRAWLALAGSHLTGLIGANAVTRNDAVLSVHAGFTGHELTALWPSAGAPWKLTEYPAGLFSHCFRAERLGVAGAKAV